MSDEFRYPDYSWIVQSTEFGQFLDITFTNDPGEIWLFNNDLRVIQHPGSFTTLYLERIAGTLREKITAVRILIKSSIVRRHGGLEESLRGEPDIVARLAQLAQLENGAERLSTFYFGEAPEWDENAQNPYSPVPPGSTNKPAGGSTPSDSWVFYLRGSDIDSGIAMLRRRHFPFHVEGDDNPFAIVWMLQHYPKLKERLQRAFKEHFSPDKLKRVDVIRTDPFDFRLVPAGHVVPKVAIRSVSIGDEVDVAVIAALQEEMTAFKNALRSERPQRIPLCGDYEYAAVSAKTGTKRVLLTTLVEQGSIPAAIRTWDLIRRWNPKHIILVGVAGGDPRDGKIKLGDIVIGNWIVGYEHGKVFDGSFMSRRTIWEADRDLLRIATGLRASGAWPRSFDMEPPPGTPAGRLTIHDDLAVASGSKLVADAKFFRKMKRDTGVDKIKAVEMEGDGVGCASYKANAKALVIKGIMDKSNKRTRRGKTTLKDDWMEYAARAAAEFALDVIREL